MKRLVAMLLALVLAAGIAGGGAFLWFRAWLDAPGPASRDTVVFIPRGTGLNGIAQRLAQENVVSRPRLLEVAAWYTETAGALKAGEYLFSPGETPRAVLERIAAGRVLFRRVTVSEGLSSAEIRRLIVSAEALQGDLPNEPTLEGSLLPETYHYVYGDSRADLVARMRRAQADLIADLWPKRTDGLPLKSPAEAIILASIVEAETPVAAERPRVAGVYINRLRRGMKLQADPTVEYGITKGETPLPQPLTRADLAQPSPWNTYVIEGLPPTPINHPGRASLAAVLQPESHDYLYFVADGRGGHLFASTYDQHLRNVSAYRATQRR